MPLLTPVTADMVKIAVTAAMIRTWVTVVDRYAEQGAETVVDLQGAQAE